MDKQERRRLSPTDAQESTISQFRNNSEDPYSKADHLAKAWESTAKAVAITSEHLKHRAIIPLLQWALSALEGARPALPTDSARESDLRLELIILEGNLAKEKEKRDNMSLRCQMLERILHEEKEKRENMEVSLMEHEKTGLRCLDLEKSLKGANDEERRQLERSLHEVENVENISLRCKQLQESLDRLKPVITEAEKILETAKQEDEKLLREFGVLRAQGMIV